MGWTNSYSQSISEEKGHQKNRKDIKRIKISNYKMSEGAKKLRRAARRKRKGLDASIVKT